MTPGGLARLSINWDEAETTAVVVLADSALRGDTAWATYVRELSNNAQTTGLSVRLFPVAMKSGGRELQHDEQALRWDRWEGSKAVRERGLVSDLTGEFIRMLRHRFRGSESTGAFLGDYLEKIQVFICHSNHDDDCEPIARSIRDWLHENSAMSSFFDVPDIPAGLSFREVLLLLIETGAVLALHTDSHSSREWCGRDVIEAKRRHVSMVVLDYL